MQGKFFGHNGGQSCLTLIFHQAHLVGRFRPIFLNAKSKSVFKRVHFKGDSYIIIKMDVGRFFIDQINSQDFLCTLEYEEGEFL